MEGSILGAREVVKDKFYEYVSNPRQYYDTIVIHHTTRAQN
jgi:hypothetical protein